MHSINIENKAYGLLGELSYKELKIAKDLRLALFSGATDVAWAAKKLADIQTEVGETNAVVRALDMLEAQTHGRLLRERHVSVTVYEHGDEWVADALLIESGGYLTAFLLGSDRVVDVLTPSEMEGSGYGPSDIADVLEHADIYVGDDGSTYESILKDGKGRESCTLEHQWE